MRNAMLVLALCLALALATVATGCGGGGSSSSTSPSPSTTSTPTGGGGQATTSVTMGDNFFKPENITAKVGATVTWKNGGALQHTVTADDGSFDSGLLDPGKTFKTTFKKAGTYKYRCTIHAGMQGTVTVN